MLQLAGLLHARGFAITVFHAPDPTNHPAYDFVPVPDDMSAGTVKVNVEHIFNVNSSCGEPFRERLAALLEAPVSREDVSCLVADAQLLTLMGMARHRTGPKLANEW